jgi:beta-lactamase class A
MKKWFRSFIATAFALSFAFASDGSAGAQDVLAPKSAIARLFTAKTIDPAWLTAAFAAQIPPATLQSVVDSLVAQLGAFRSVEPSGDAYVVLFEKGSAQATVMLEGTQIAALRFYGLQSDAGAARLAALFTTVPVPASWFAALFLAQIPVEKVQTIIAGLEAQLGAYRSVRANADGSYEVLFAKGSDNAQIHLDGDGKIDGLFFKPPKLAASNLDDAVASLRALPGTVSYLVLQGGTERAAFNARRPLAIGSAFKLAVLCALLDRIERGDLHWADVVTLEAGDKSLPSGVLQTWPDGSRLTLETLASLMISQSDNTAADMLLRVAGAAALAQYAGGNDPFLTTRQFFVLKSLPGSVLRERWRRSDSTGRHALLPSIDALPLPRAGDVDTSPKNLDVEWYYSNAQLCAFIGRVGALPLMSINPGVADPRDWRRIAYKGGSDFGVLNFTTRLDANDGTTYCVSATWNDAAAPLDEARFGTLYSSILAALFAEAATPKP